MITTIPQPPNTDEFGLTRSDRRKFRVEFVNAAARSLAGSDFSNWSSGQFSGHIITIAERIERHVLRKDEEVSK